MSRTREILLRVGGGLVGLLAGGAAVGGLGALAGILLVLLLLRLDGDSGDTPGFLGVVILLAAGLGSVVGAATGAAKGATVVRRSLKRTSSFRMALLGTFVGLVVGILSLALVHQLAILMIPGLMVAGAVIGSGWRGEPAGTDLTDRGGT